MTKLILATRNPHKTREFAQILGQGFSVSDLTTEAGLAEVEETGISFEENAILKAMAAARVQPGLVVADDSGLEVDALGGAPGIYSARYAGKDATDVQNIAKIMTELGSSPNRKARFCCALALVCEGETLGIFHGTLDGCIARQTAGANGFGYDPIFVPLGYGRTLAELGAETKNRISHRTKAIHALQTYLKTTARD